MAELSRFEKMEADAFQTAANKLEEVLVRQGVDRARACEFIEKEVTLVRMPPGLRIYPSAGDLRSRGHSDDCLVHFARQLHLQHEDELGGAPVRGGKVPERDADIERRERIKETQEKGAAFRERMEQVRLGVQQEAAKRNAVDSATLVRSML